MDIPRHELELLSRAAAAKEMKISPSTLNNLINEGKIGVLPIGNREKIPVEEIRRYIKDNIVRCNRVKENYYFRKRKAQDILSRPLPSADSMEGARILSHLLEQVN